MLYTKDNECIKHSNPHRKKVEAAHSINHFLNGLDKPLSDGSILNQLEFGQEEACVHTQRLGLLDNKITILTHNILLGTISMDPGAPHKDN